ncbi:MAG: phospholipase [Anaerolineae bacterium]|nr:phospholipase [Anaerolineae bacterium]
MTKKKSKSSSSQSRTLLMVAGLLILFIIAGVLFGWDQALNMAGQLLGLTEEPQTATINEGQPAQAEAPSDQVDEPPAVAVEEIAGEGDYYQVYFTNPVNPFDDVTTGGVDDYLVELINSAQTSIVAAMFELDLQNVADALIAAHDRGVDVRIVYDDEHTEDDPQMEEIIDAGIPATPDERSAFMHNKFFVIDGKTVWTGSMNITINGVYRNNNNVIVIQSPALAENYTAEFEEMFNGEFGPRSPSNTPNPVINLGNVQIENYFGPEDEIIPRLVELVSGAQSSIKFMTFSFTHDDLGEAMRERAYVGVEVTGIFETRGADTEYSECGYFIDAGQDVRLDGNPYTFHHKVIIIDDSIVVIGSFNFSENAASSNDENLLIVHDPAVAAIYVQEFNRRFAEAVVPTGGGCKTD